ncbi:hypothetical protein CYLTODRAFT_413241 [Cylindrobasidium torrendii FP15055 ss-10]|uniref:Uncharacterized protein n=1 Tax=Cylindrobasidium torrendii FP15055 ss-10 TaxID=1314674 RepID=A0A0D7B1Q7_9AGAR|nr:hypothetical protein CYLTODRAFT_413241 [Cylindrobasidium torrendii FP15055 ss-10]
MRLGVTVGVHLGIETLCPDGNSLPTIPKGIIPEAGVRLPSAAVAAKSFICQVFALQDQMMISFFIGFKCTSLVSSVNNQALERVGIGNDCQLLNFCADFRWSAQENATMFAGEEGRVKLGVVPVKLWGFLNGCYSPIHDASLVCIEPVTQLQILEI